MSMRNIKIVRSGDRDYLYRLGPTEQAFYRRTEAHPGLETLFQIKITKMDTVQKKLSLYEVRKTGYLCQSVWPQYNGSIHSIQ
jgi:hypothetical protein